ncbi:MAG: phosphatidylserine decarboxylase [Acidobacteriota bacterium]|nr:phosphatidylserine decarboxylase [Acidobacteriota bacterium]
MVRDGIYYALGLVAVAAVVGWLTAWPWALIPLPLAAFFLWFFRDPEREVPQQAGVIVSPADGKVTEVATVELEGQPRTRISIFLNVFNVHVNRSPIGGVVEKVEYRAGNFGNAMGAVSSEANEQNIVTVAGDGHTLVFKQIAGLLARRIVFTKKVGDKVARGERIGLIKFGSRCDVIFDSGAELRVKVGDKVAGGSSVLAIAAVPVTAGSNTVTNADRNAEARR